MYKALVIGCGNIGAQYDMHNNEIQSHVKAWYLNPLVSLHIYDINRSLVENVADKYNCEIIDSLEVDVLKEFTFVSICTPTATHLNFLEMALAAKVNVVICEKPVSNNYEDLEQIKSIYEINTSKVLINYMRRFLPPFMELKQFISSIKPFEKLTNISIRYQRGFINNCSHAFDLIAYLTDIDIDLSHINRFNLIADHFIDDPTLSLQALWGDVNFNVQGLSNVNFSHFEIDLYFNYHKIVVKNAGNIIEILKAEKTDGNLKPLILQAEHTRNNCLENYMKHVIDYAVDLKQGRVNKDNFINAVTLNQKMLRYKDN
ncbi:MAG: Gfo/Idh/MocA family oxidoreductase [Bacteroidota bacterium]